MSCDCFVCILEMVETNFQAQLAVAHAKYNADCTFAVEALLFLKTNIMGMDRSEKKSHSTSSLINNIDGRFWQILDLMMTDFDRLNLQNTSVAMDLLHQAYCFMIDREICTYFTPSDMLWSVLHNLTRETASLPKEEFQDLFKATYSNQILEKPEKYTFYVSQKVLWDCMKMGKENLLCGLLKYGVMFFPAPYHEEMGFEFEHHKEVVRYLLCAKGRRRLAYNIAFNEDTFPTDCDMPAYRFHLVLRVMELFALALKSKLEKGEEASHEVKRPRLLRSAEDGSASSSVYFRCLRRVFDTVPEPHVTSTELRKIFGLFDLESHENVDELIADFENFYPEAAGPLAPRSLQHLSRCQVRENLRQSGTLPHGIKNLVPSILEKYILLEE